MDSVTQAVFGAGIQGALLGRFQGRKALLYGAVIATLPDLDVFLGQPDPVSAMINHRGFSHSLFVLSAVSVGLTILFRAWRPSADYSFGRLLLCIWLSLITHPLLDALTSYGTQLWWPLKPTPTSWSSLFIIDPFFTVPLIGVTIAGFLVGMKGRVPRTCAWALAWCCVYIAASLSFKQVIETRVRNDLMAGGTSVVRIFSTPTPFNILAWRVVAQVDRDEYVEAIVGVFDQKPFERARLPLNAKLAMDLPDSPLLPGLRWFTGDWLRYDEIGNSLVVSDLRMGLATGYYSFRFKMGEGQPHAWHPVVPSMWPTNRGGMAELGMLWDRLLGRTTLPLTEWEQRMHVVPVKAPAPTPVPSGK
ncbi:metal-dependent hydrolase [Pigmentiphaga aceris]|uniref:Metal-dependent hydrolase n=1 Tax=Pigmentiphaga aceris TaxID=1940612 RepID=A0A5C0AXB9_9BURK|nr:metal-dependent hydrolase [Pigmentiphaga aceris]QEI06775.1 metal-dependent hydrolase [Pigmentiphaga aceris]